jgi:hypothetical protein
MVHRKRNSFAAQKKNGEFQRSIILLFYYTEVKSKTESRLQNNEIHTFLYELHKFNNKLEVLNYCVRLRILQMTSYSQVCNIEITDF